MKNVPRKHAEAFHLMTYQCERCVLQEVIWNSRDGVTPFGIRCEHCGGHAYHVNWQDDVRADEYGAILHMDPRPAATVKRVFVDAKPHHQHIIDAADKYVEEWWDNAVGQITMRKTMFPMDKDAAKQFFIKEWTKPGEPTIITVEQYLREHVTA